MDKTEPSRVRRWPLQFGLRTTLALTALLAVVLSIWQMVRPALERQWKVAKTVDDIEQIGGAVIMESGGIEVVCGAVDDNRTPPWTDGHLRKASELLKPRSELRSLIIRKNVVTDAGLQHLRHLPFLKELEVSWSLFITDAGLTHLEGLSRLEKLTLSDVRGVHGSGLACLHEMPNLTILDLHWTPITDAGVAELDGMKQLRELNLGSTCVTDEAAVHLATLTGLEKLSLYHTRISNSALRYLVMLPNLRELELGQNPDITHAGIDDLKRFTQLRKLGLDETNLSTSGLREIRAALPGVKVTWHQMCSFQRFEQPPKSAAPDG